MPCNWSERPTARPSAPDLRSVVVDVSSRAAASRLIERIAREARVPVIKHLDGICHVYIDDGADVEMAIRVADNAKTQRYSPCNTMETLLVARTIAAAVLPRLGARARRQGGRAARCAATRQLLDAAGIARRRPPRRTGAPNISPRSSRSGSSTASTRRSRTSTATARITPTRSSPPTTATRCGSCARSIRPRCWSTPRRDSPTGSSSVSAPRSASPPTSSMRAVRSDSKD